MPASKKRVIKASEARVPKSTNPLKTKLGKIMVLVLILGFVLGLVLALVFTLISAFNA